MLTGIQKVNSSRRELRGEAASSIPYYFEPATLHFWGLRVNFLLSFSCLRQKFHKKRIIETFVPFKIRMLTLKKHIIILMRGLLLALLIHWCCIQCFYSSMLCESFFKSKLRSMSLICMRIKNKARSWELRMMFPILT